MPFYPGDIVRLKSGGPAMTVQQSDDQQIISCSWFASDVLKAASFSDKLLDYSPENTAWHGHLHEWTADSFPNGAHAWLRPVNLRFKQMNCFELVENGETFAGEWTADNDCVRLRYADKGHDLRGC